MRVPPAHLTYRAHCTVEVSCFLRHATEHSPKTSTWSGVVTCGAHAHQGSRMRPNTYALVHSVHRAAGTLNGLGLCPAGVAACLSKHSTRPHCHLSQNNILPEVLEVPSPLLWKSRGSESLQILLSKDEAEMGQHLPSTCQVLTASAGSLLRGIYEA